MNRDTPCGLAARVPFSGDTCERRCRCVGGCRQAGVGLLFGVWQRNIPHTHDSIDSGRRQVPFVSFLLDRDFGSWVWFVRRQRHTSAREWGCLSSGLSLTGETQTQMRVYTFVTKGVSRRIFLSNGEKQPRTFATEYREWGGRGGARELSNNS